MSTDERRIIEDFKASILDAELRTFEDFMEHLKQPEVIQGAKKFFELLVIKGQGAPTVGQSEPVNARVLLAAFLCIHYSNHVFGTFGLTEQKLVTASRDMHATILNVIGEFNAANKSLAGVTAETWAAWRNATNGYLSAFSEWKELDKPKLLQRLKDAILMLRQLLSDSALSSEKSAEVSAQIERMRAKMAEVYGQEMLDAFDATSPSLD